MPEPVTAFVLAILMVGERPVWVGVLGLVVLLTGLARVVRQEMTASRG